MSLKFGSSKIARKSVPAAAKAALDKYVEEAGIKPAGIDLPTKNGHIELDILKHFDWRIAFTMKDNEALALGIQKVCGCGKCPGGVDAPIGGGKKDYRSITKAELLKAIQKQVAEDTAKLMRDALGPADKARLLEMQSQLKDAEAAKARQHAEIVNALKKHLADLEAAVKDLHDMSKLTTVMSRVEVPAAIKTTLNTPVVLHQPCASGCLHFGIILSATSGFVTQNAMSKPIETAYVKLGLTVPSAMLTPLWQPVLSHVSSLELIFN